MPSPTRLSAALTAALTLGTATAHAKKPAPADKAAAAAEAAPAPAVEAAAPAGPLSGTFKVDPKARGNTLSAVFVAPLGERITAAGSVFDCTFTVDATSGAPAGSCSVPLESLKVDGDQGKTKHFQEWATQNKGKAKGCKFEVTLGKVTLDGPLQGSEPVAFEGEVAFTLCGRARADGASEKVTGSVTVLPKGGYSPTGSTLRLKVKVPGFDREAYGIGPAFTEGWIARVQELAPKVGKSGDLELGLFAIEQGGK